MKIKDNEIYDNQKIVNEQIKEEKQQTDNIILNKQSIDINKDINNLELLKKIFKFDESIQQYFPIFNLDCSKEILIIFDYGVIPKFSNKEDLFVYIKEKIDIIQQIKKIINHSYELLQIIINYLRKNNISLINFYIDLYFECCIACRSENPIKDILQENFINNALIKDIKNIINYIICCGFLRKENIDYFYQKIAELQLKNKLYNYVFYEYLELIDILYGKNYDKQFKDKLIAKDYLYFYNKEKSGIKINISNDKNNININDGCTIIMWFYLNDPIKDNNDKESIICEMKINEHHNFKFIINNQNDIIIKWNDILLDAQNKQKFNLEKYKWIQLKIQFNKNKRMIKLNIFQGDINSLFYNPSSEDNENYEKQKYETKIYSLIDIPNFDVNNFILKSLNFFINFIGIVGTIVFCNKDNPSEIPISSNYGLKSNKISNFLGEAGLSDTIYFIFAPSLFVYEKYKFIDLSHNIIGEINNNKNNNNIIEFNNVFKYKNYSNNIYYLGGTSNLLPLFEIFYKFTINVKNNDNDEEKLLFIIFKKLFKILELIFINKKKNYLEALYNNQVDNNLFFESLQLFLKLIDEKYYQQDNEILNSLLIIGKSIFKYCRGKDKNNKEMYNYFKNILFNPYIVIKFNLSQLDILWNFFQSLKTSENIFSNSYYKKCFMSFDNLNLFLSLLTQKYKNNNKKVALISPSLLHIIRIIFEDSSTNDKERENLLIFNSNNEILKGIIEIFIFYLDINKNNIVDKYSQNNPDKINLFKEEDIKESVINSRNNSVHNFLESSNNFIEMLLNIFSTTNLNLKKVIINFIKVLTQKYGEILDNYFNNIDSIKKKSKGIFNRIDKKEFYYFIEENITPNYFNFLIQNKKESKIKDKNINKRKTRHKTMKEIRKIKINKNTECNDLKNEVRDNKDNKIDDKNNEIMNKNHNENNIKNIKNDENKNINNDNKSELNDIDKNHIHLDVNLKIINENKNKRSSSLRNKKMSNIKLNFMNKIEYELNKEKIKKLAIHCANYCISKETANKCYFNTNNFIPNNNNLGNKENEKELINNNENINGENINIENLDKENISKKLDKDDKDDELNLKEIQIINCEISMILFDWLMKMNSYKKPTDKNIKNNKNSNKSNSFEEEKIINFLIKFLSNTKELEVIYRLLFIIKSQKLLGSINKIGQINEKYSNSNYYHLLDNFSFSNTKFMQLLEELLINSYLCIYDENSRKKFIFIAENDQIRSGINSIDEYFNFIYMKSKELLLDIYFHENNENKNKIIDDIINIMILLDEEPNKYININIFDLLLKLLETLLLEIGDLYHKKLDKNDFKNNFIEETSVDDIKNNLKDSIKVKDKTKIIYNENIINNKYNIHYNSLIKNYIGLSPFIFEYCLLINNHNDFISHNIKTLKMENDCGFPDYFGKYNNLNVYIKFYEEIDNIFNIMNLLNEKNKNDINKFDDDKEVYVFTKNEISKLVNDYIYNKDYKNKLKDILELLLMKYNDSQLPLIEIVSILNNYCIEKYLNINESSKINFIPKGNIFLFLNSHQFFILYIILISCNIKENDNYLTSNTNYKEIQDILYVSLRYNINNIVNNFSSSISPFFFTVFNNILSLISKIWVMFNEKGGRFFNSNNFDFNKTSVKKLLTKYNMLKYTSFFDTTNFNALLKNSIVLNENLIIDEKKNIIKQVITRTNEEINEKPIIDIFELNKIENIYINRISQINKIKLLLNYENMDNIFHINILNDEDLNHYKNIYLRINKLKIKHEFNHINECYKNIRNRNNYRKIKKRLYSWNNSYSNLHVFYYQENNKKDDKKDIYKIKYKISNFLSKDLSRKLVVPIIDLDYYMPNFRDFDYKTKLFEENNDNKNKNEFIYKIDLKIFNQLSDNILPNLDNQNYYIDEACYIQTTHHIRGKIFISVNNNSNNIYFSTNKKNLLSHEEFKKYEDYDSGHFSCLGSIFQNNTNPKDSEIYIKINYNEINFIFNRKYCFRNNSVEIYTNNNKSYYFKFINDKKRNSFIDNMICKFNKIIPKKQLFKPIKGIDENNKSIIIGYFRDEDNNKDFSNISYIRDLWKLNKISTFEYLMWINIYGNRSFRDIAQYPIFPWLLNNYEHDNFEELISEIDNIRDFRLPMGMLVIDEKSKSRQEGYIETYKIMVMQLLEENLIKLKIKEEEYIEDPPNLELNNKRHSAKFGELNSPELDIKKKSSSSSLDKYSINVNNANNNNNENNKNKKDSSIYIKPIYNIPSYDKYNDDKLPKLLDYSINLNKIYNNLDIEYEKIPYCFGSHFSNASYVCHYLSRLFPYSSVMIEIQGSGFDCPDRLFLNLQKSLYSSITEKSDIREIIPELYTIPELFLNINNFNFGKIENNNYENDENIENKIKSNENIIIHLDEGKKMKQVEEVILPTWCKNSPYYFIEKNKILLENLNINSWIDLIFGYLQRGNLAQIIGNLYSPYVYDGVMDLRVKPEDIINDRNENECKMKLFEMGVHPTKVFEKKCKINKNKINNQLISSSYSIENPENILYEINLKTNNNKIIYFKTKNTSSEELFIIDKNFIKKKIIIQENKELNNYSYKESITDNELPIKKIIIKNIEYKLIMKEIYNGAFYIISGLFDGELYIIRNINKKEKEYKNENLKIKIFDKSLITSLEIDKDEKYMIYGTQNGSLVIYILNYSLFKEGKDFINLVKFFPSHTGYSINSIYINSDLNLFADCAYDGYANIYTLPKCKLIRSIFIEPNLKNNFFSLDYIFLSAQPLASIVLYSNKTCNFKCFSINGNELFDNNYDYDEKLIKDNKNNLDELGMSSPILFSDSHFNDYLLYILNKKYILVKKFPFMENIIFINPSLVKEEKLNNVAISNDLKYLYIYEEINNKIYIIHNNNIYININKENKDNKVVHKKSG